MKFLTVAVFLAAAIAQFGCERAASDGPKTVAPDLLANDSLAEDMPANEVALTSNVTRGGYCILSHRVDDDRSVPVLARLEGDTIVPIAGAEIGEVRIPMADDYVVELDNGIVCFLGNKDHGHTIVHYDTSSTAVKAIGKEQTALISEWPHATIQGSDDDAGQAFVFADKVAFVVDEIGNDAELYKGLVRVRSFDREGVRRLEVMGVPYGAFGVSNGAIDGLVLHVGREEGPVLVLVAATSASGARLESMTQTRLKIKTRSVK